MPRNFFAKLTHFFELVFDPSRRAANSDGAGSQARTSAPQRPPTPFSTQDTTPLSQPATTMPATLPSVPPLSTAPTPIPPDAEPAPIPVPPPSIIPVSSPPSSLPVVSPTPSSSALVFHSRERGMFHNAHDFVLNNPQFVDFSPAESGFKQLLEHSMLGTFHDSGTRYPPPKCHLGTRNEYIDLITNWALGESDRKEHILWMHGPFGIGKSAVAQSCAEALASINKLAATLFFSRSNADRDDPQRVFTSIAYQIATKCPSFREIINTRMAEDPALATKSLSKQFEDLLVQPLGQIDLVGSGLDKRIVIIDGLDECRGTADQCEIIKIIAASVHKCTTPFRWFITSRPEVPIIRTMNSPAVSPVRSRVELPVSRAIDHEVLVYLTDEFKLIREDHGLPESWPEEGALALLVERGAGLWIYVSIIIRFIKDENSYGPEDQLRIVLEFAKEVSAKVGPDNPLAEMDFFYTLIMQRVPLKVRTTIYKILLVLSMLSSSPKRAATILCLSAEQLRRACAFIQSVMELQGSDLKSMSVNFYHTSFLDFMTDPRRSRMLCIHGDFLIECRREILGWLHEVCSHSTDSLHLKFPSGTVLPTGVSRIDHYITVLDWFWVLCGVPEHLLDSQTAMSLAKLPFKKMLRLMGFSSGLVDALRVRGNLPAEICDEIIRKGKCPILGCTNTENVWILGHGGNESVPGRHRNGDLFVLMNNQDWPSGGKCFCGAQMQRDRDSQWRLEQRQGY